MRFLEPNLTWTRVLVFAEKGFRQHQFPSGAGHEIREMRIGTEANAENSATGESQAGHHCQQYASAKVTEK